MTFGYSAGSGRLRKKGLLVAMGMVAIPLSFHIHSLAASAPAKPKAPVTPRDPRIARLQKFLAKLECPVAGLSADFVRAADQNHLDWRLLPSIAIVESGGGKVYKNNNIFGWGGGEQAFGTVRAGLELVAYKLGHGPLYRRHDSLGKLHIYNENQQYADAVMAVMNRISPEATLRPVAYTSNVREFETVRY